MADHEWYFHPTAHADVCVDYIRIGFLVDYRSSKITPDCYYTYIIIIIKRR